MEIQITKPSQGEVLKKGDNEKIKGSFTVGDLTEKTNYTMVINIYRTSDGGDRDVEVVSFDVDPN